METGRQCQRCQDKKKGVNWRVQHGAGNGGGANGGGGTGGAGGSGGTGGAGGVGVQVV